MKKDAVATRRSYSLRTTRRKEHVSRINALIPELPQWIPDIAMYEEIEVYGWTMTQAKRYGCTRNPAERPEAAQRQRHGSDDQNEELE